MPGHVGDQAPLDLQHRQLHVGGDEAQVGAQGELEAAAEGHAVHRGDHRDGDLAPDHAGLLRAVRPALRALGREQAAEVVAGCRSARPRPWPGSLPMSSPAQNARPSPDSTTARTPGSRLQPLAGLDQGREHGVVEGVHLVGAHQAHVGDAFVQINRDAIFHERSSHSAGKFMIRPHHDQA